jgi:hypothetical protein
VIALLALLAAGVALGRWAGRPTPAFELLCFLTVTAIVLAQLAAWRAGIVLDPAALLRGLVTGAP